MEIQSNSTRALSILVENRFGALFKIVGAFCARGYNIETLTVAPTREGGLSRVAVTFECDANRSKQVEEQLRKIVDVVEVREASMQGDSNGKSLLRTGC